MEKKGATVIFDDGVYVKQAAAIAGKKEGQGPMGKWFDEICMDDRFGKKSWEEAESELLRRCCLLALRKAELLPEDIGYVFCGDLQNQTTASSFGLKDFEIPQFGLYSACSTMGEALALGAMTAAAGYAGYVLCASSSHFACAEKTFRNPLDYGSQRPYSATWTVTGAGAAVLGGESGPAKICAVTAGRIVDYGVKDPMNMGAAMAPAAADTICAAMRDLGMAPSDFDRIITGDLGIVGRRALNDLMRNRRMDISDCHIDCGIEMFDEKRQDTHSGGSGCGCSASLFCSYILEKLRTGEWRNVLFCPTGALMSQSTFHEEASILGICHAVYLKRGASFDDL